MTFKMAINITTILVSCIAALASFSTWALLGIYNQAEAQFTELKQHKEETHSRLAVLETQTAERWEQIIRELERINRKIDANGK